MRRRAIRARASASRPRSGGATVAASAASAVIGSNVVSPSVGSYALVPAGTAVNVSVNGASVSAPAAPLVAGSDSTLLVYGSVAAPAAILIVDDNHLPSVTTNLKLRLVNGMNGASRHLDAASRSRAMSRPTARRRTAWSRERTALRVDVFTPTSPTPSSATPP